jgi:hypothetical protein
MEQRASLNVTLDEDLSRNTRYSEEDARDLASSFIRSQHKQHKVLIITREENK